MADDVEVTDMGWTSILRDLARAENASVSVGVHEGEKSSEGASLAFVGAAQEYGTVHIDARPWLGVTIDENEDELMEFADKLYWGPMLDGRLNARQALGLVGQKAEDKVKATIRDGRAEWPPLKPATIKKKGSSKPLIDTGQLIQGIRHKVEI